jgi:hypothetical protein
VLTAIRRVGLPVAVFAVLGSAVAGCGSGPSQANSAVIIGQRVITVDDVQHRLDDAISREQAARDLAKNHKLDVVSRGIVDQLIRHELITEAAKRENLSVSEKDVSDAQAGAAPSEDPTQKAIDAGFDAHELTRDRLLMRELGKKYVEKLRVTFVGLQVVSSDARKKSDDIAHKVAASPGQAEQIFQQAGSPPSGGDPNASPEAQAIPAFPLTAQRGYDIAAQNQVLLTPLFGVAQHSVVAFPLGSGEQAASAGWIVAYIQERNLNAPPEAPDSQQQQGTPVSQIPAQWLELVGRQMTAPLAGELGVRISPRYGVWDELAVGVAPSEGEKVGIVVAGNTKP